MKELTSLKNPVVQAARALDTAKERTRQGAFLCDGEHMAGEALSVCPERVRTLFVELRAYGQGFARHTECVVGAKAALRVLKSIRGGKNPAVVVWVTCE